MTANRDEKPARVCMTPDECFDAGWADGEGDRMPADLIDRMVALHGPYLLPADEQGAAEQERGAA